MLVGIGIGIYVALAGFIFWLIYTAPEGYQDETGFHYGRKDHGDPL